VISQALFSAVSDRLRGAPLVVLCLPAPNVSVERLFDAVSEGERSFFAPDDGVVCLAGRGRALHLTASSLSALRSKVSSILDTVGVVSTPDADSTVRVLGGQAFDPRRPHDHDLAWSDFPGASLTLPRWTLTHTNGRSTLQVAFTQDHNPEGDVIHRVLRALDTPSPVPQDTRSHATVLSGDRCAWEALVRQALTALGAGHAEKLVAARRVEIRTDVPWDLRPVLSRLGTSPGCARFAFEHTRSIFLGASPERLVVRQGSVANADALAGSSPRRQGCELHDAHSLLANPKDRREHALVVEGICAALAPHCEAMEVPEVPRVRTLPWLHHLWSPVRARLRSEAPAHVLDLVTALHPTPALGGSPRDLALDWIQRHEHHPRGWYAAPVGWCDAAGDGEFFVAIRAAVLRGDRAWAWAGAGLVPGSDPASEWNETEAKLSAVCAALGALR